MKRDISRNFTRQLQDEMNMPHIEPNIVLPMGLPMPLGFYTNLNIASRTTIWRWEKEGLRIVREGGRTYLIPDDLVAFLTRNAEETVNPQEPKERN
jgi:hypothetical protein